MSDTHIQGRILDTNQLGAIPCMRGYMFDKTDTTARTLCTIDATATNPVFLEIYPDINTAFNAGTTNVVVIKNQSGATLVTFPDPTVTGIQSYRTMLIFTKTSLNIQYSYTGTAPTTGQGIVLVRVSGLGKGVGMNLNSLQ